MATRDQLIECRDNLLRTIERIDKMTKHNLLQAYNAADTIPDRLVNVVDEADEYIARVGLIKHEIHQAFANLMLPGRRHRTAKPDEQKKPRGRPHKENPKTLSKYRIGDRVRYTGDGDDGDMDGTIIGIENLEVGHGYRIRWDDGTIGSHDEGPNYTWVEAELGPAKSKTPPKAVAAGVVCKCHEPGHFCPAHGTTKPDLIDSD